MKRRSISIRLYGASSQRANIFIFVAVRTSSLSRHSKPTYLLLTNIDLQSGRINCREMVKIRVIQGQKLEEYILRKLIAFYCAYELLNLSTWLTWKDCLICRGIFTYLMVLLCTLVSDEHSWLLLSLIFSATGTSQSVFSS
jgi:hypothetical protein